MEYNENRLVSLKTISILEIIFGSLGIFLFLILTVSVDNPFLMLCFAGVSCWVVVDGSRRSNLLRLCHLYIYYLSEDPSHSIAAMACKLHTTPQTVITTFEKLIRKGYLTDIVLDPANGCVVFVNASPAKHNSFVYQKTASHTPPAGPTGAPAHEYVTVTCKGCGATNRIQRGIDGECEFCGSTLRIISK